MSSAGLLDVRFTHGINAADDARMVDTPYLLAAENVMFDGSSTGPKKRTGYDALGNLATEYAKLSKYAEARAANGRS